MRRAVIRWRSWTGTIDGKDGPGPARFGKASMNGPGRPGTDSPRRSASVAKTLAKTRGFIGLGRRMNITLVRLMDTECYEHGQGDICVHRSQRLMMGYKVWFRKARSESNRISDAYDDSKPVYIHEDAISVECSTS